MPDALLKALLTAAYIGGYTAVSATLLRHGHTRRFPFFFAFAITSTIAGALTWLLHGHRSLYATYFWVYWGAELITALLLFGTLYDVVRAIPLAAQMPRELRWFFLTVAVLLTAAMGLAAWQTTPHTAYVLTNLALSLHRAIAFAWAAFTVAALCSISLLGLAWPLQSLRIAQGVVWQSLIGMPAAYLLSRYPAHAPAIQITRDALSLAALPLWINAARIPDWRCSHQIAAPQPLRSHL